MISVIVCTYNRDAYIYKTLECIANNNFPLDEYEIILIDNNCTDNTVSECERFRKNFPDVPYFYFKELQQGLSFARNRGISEAKGDTIVFIDDDAYVQTDYLKNLKQNLEEHPEAMAFGGKITPLYESGNEPEWMSSWLIPIVSAIDKSPNIVAFEGKSYPIGANMGFRKNCLETIGLFNTALGRTKKNLLGGEEKDIFDRLHRNNMKILYFPTVALQHVIPESRTTMEYIRRMSYGVGVSEKIRCSGKPFQYLKSIAKEAWKWCGSLVLSVLFLIKNQYPKAKAIIVFRWNVSMGLLTKKQYND
ncbi:MAG: glycosyltransferase [Bacteroidales bacterium]|nr:glycosyltransferase [Bacteroidales bacterium]